MRVRRSFRLAEIERVLMNKPKIVIATTKSWNLENARRLQQDYAGRIDTEIVSEKAHLTAQYLQRVDPHWVFLPHWSWIIPDEIILRWQCVIFHTSRLPWGRGGSPIQNQIVRGVYESEVCALRAVAEVDAGPVYARRKIDLSKGTVEEILMQVSEFVFDMIPTIALDQPSPVAQNGDLVSFKRRKPRESQLPEQAKSLRRVYDHIRMLDGEGYPLAYLEYGNQTVELRDARLHPDGVVTGTFRLRIDDRKGE